ncbi:hypothetical protein BC6307_19965 [Sutcliffiella cohnii]|uniref:SH3b domain-containing protein n=1 Tax=Sutcliffiella cohnii TaxID=33932 RepID=A0A223KV79_9BACI|nr:SH3 domain-containing protein [Sutcliffiella cohnii]AST93376.1 hypothetical protein BC6307_19965 [Sutcliffiella cohnii]
MKKTVSTLCVLLLLSPSQFVMANDSNANVIEEEFVDTESKEEENAFTVDDEADARKEDIIKEEEIAEVELSDIDEETAKDIGNDKQTDEQEVIEKSSVTVNTRKMDTVEATTITSIESDKGADYYYEQAVNENSASKKLELFIEGYEKYPNDSRFVDGIQSSAQSLLTWARRQHNQQQFTTAIDRYERILRAPQLNNAIQKSTEKHLSYANSKKLIPSADSLYSIASKQTTVSGIFASYVDAYEWYPEDGRFQQGLQSSAQNLYNWAIRQHDSGNFSTAIARYETILSVAGINQTIISNVESRLADAKIGKRSAKIILDLAVNESSASRKLALYVEGYEFYPNDKRFIDGIQTGSQLLLNWAKGQHNRGNYDTAIDRYNTILNTPIVNDVIIQSTEKHLEYALAKKVIPSADQLFNTAKAQTQVSAIFQTYAEGFELYPNDQRFVEGLQKSAQNLFNWAVRQHDAGNYETAINRYEMILAVSGINNSLLGSVQSRLTDAKIGKRPANVIFDLAQKETSASKILELYIEGFTFYPNDSRFVSGIEPSAISLFIWATNKHQAGDIDTALSRYQNILSAPTISNELIKKTTIQLSFAKKNELIPTPNGFYNIAMEVPTLTNRLNMMLDGWTIYNESSVLVNGINTTAGDLLSWASNQHENGQFGTAINRYQLILDIPVLADIIKQEAQLKLSYANKNLNYPSAQQQFEYASSQTSASHLLAAFIDGYILYPQDDRFIEGINSSAVSLLNWATNQHRNGNYSTAADRYERILSAPEVRSDILLEAEIKQSYAAKNQQIPSANQLINEAESNNSATGKFNLFINGYVLYPSDERFIYGVNASALNLLNWAKIQHENRRFDTAIDRYNRILNAPGVSNSVKEMASRLLVSAEKKETPKREFITYTQYNVTLSSALRTQMSLRDLPQTDRYRNAPAYIQTSSISEVYTRGIATAGSNLRTTPSLTGSVAFTVVQGTTFEILGSEKGDMWNGSDIWYKVRFEKRDLYIHSNLASSTNIGKLASSTPAYESTSTTSHVYGTRNAESEVVLVNYNKNSNWQQISLGAWRNAKESDVLSMLDPNNNDIFQHLVLTSSVGVSATQINNLLSGKGVLQGKGQAFIDASLLHSVNEVYLISHALLETSHGKSDLATGKLEVGKDRNGNLQLVTSSNRSSLTDIKPTYNMFGIGANDGDAERLGAFRAYREGWFTVDAAIIGGARFIGEDYIHNQNGQNTIYKMRWNPANPGTKQYATDVEWATKQLPNIKNMYNQLEAPVLHFDIPKYK